MSIFDCVDDCSDTSNCWSIEEDRSIDQVCDARTKELAKKGKCPSFPSEGCLDQTESLFPWLIDKGCMNDISCSGAEKCCKNGCPLYDQFECVRPVHSPDAECKIGSTTVSNWSCGALGIVFLITILSILSIVTCLLCYFLRPSGGIFSNLNEVEKTSKEPRETPGNVVQPSRVVQPGVFEETEATALWRPVENEVVWGEPVYNRTFNY